MQTKSKLSPEERANILRGIDEFELESSPCENCSFGLLCWSNRYCGSCGFENSNYDPAFAGPPEEEGWNCLSDHAEGLRIKVITVEYPYCFECGTKVL